MNNNVKNLFLIDTNSVFMTNYGSLKGNLERTSPNKKNLTDDELLSIALKAKDNSKIKIMNLLMSMKPDYTLCSFDDINGNYWRKDIIDSYKSNREEKHKSVKEAILMLKKELEDLNITNILKDNYESDDIIGSICNRLRNVPKINVTVISKDKDFYQLYYDNIRGLNPFKMNDGYIIEENVKEKFGGLSRNSVAEILALSGDASDGIPGIPNVGEKTAIKWIKDYSGLENLILCCDNMGKRGESLNKNKEKINDYMKIIDLSYISINIGLKLSDMKSNNNFFIANKYGSPNHNNYGY